MFFSEETSFSWQSSVSSCMSCVEVEKQLIRISVLSLAGGLGETILMYGAYYLEQTLVRRAEFFVQTKADAGGIQAVSVFFWIWVSLR
jgi:hypothetical protein